MPADAASKTWEAIRKVCGKSNRSAEDAVTRGECGDGHKLTGYWFLSVAVIPVLLFMSCQLDEKLQKKLAADHAAALAAVLKRNQAIADYIPSLSEWVKSGSLEGKQLRKPYPTLEEMEKRIGAPNNAETPAPPGTPARVMPARWYYGSGTDRADLALEAEFLEEGGAWRLIGISFWRGRDSSPNTMEYIGRDVMFWKETRYNKR